MEDSVFGTVLLPIALAVIMTSLGTSLTLDDFRRVAVYPNGIAIGLVNLVVLSPLLAFGIAELFALEPAMAVGLVVLGASPGGILANLMTHLARGETALSISMTAISSLAAVVTVPLALSVGVDHFGASGFDEDVDMLSVVPRVLAIIVIPLSLGMWLRANREQRIEEIGPGFRRVAAVVFVGTVIGVIVAENERVLENLDSVAAAAVALNVAAMTISFWVARLARLDDRQSTAIAMELGSPQHGPRDRRRRDRGHQAHDPGGGLRLVHVHLGGALRAAHVPAKRRPGGDRHLGGLMLQDWDGTTGPSWLGSGS